MPAEKTCEAEVEARRYFNPWTTRDTATFVTDEAAFMALMGPMIESDYPL